jgi:hypothetical protein
MVQTRCNTHVGREIKIEGDTIVVDEFVCLGIYITKYRDELKAMRRRIRLASNTYATHYSP